MFARLLTFRMGFPYNCQNAGLRYKTGAGSNSIPKEPSVRVGLNFDFIWVDASLTAV